MSGLVGIRGRVFPFASSASRDPCSAWRDRLSSLVGRTQARGGTIEHIARALGLGPYRPLLVYTFIEDVAQCLAPLLKLSITANQLFEVMARVRVAAACNLRVDPAPHRIGQGQVHFRHCSHLLSTRMALRWRLYQRGRSAPPISQSRLRRGRNGDPLGSPRPLGTGCGACRRRRRRRGPSSNWCPGVLVGAGIGRSKSRTSAARSRQAATSSGWRSTGSKPGSAPIV